MTDCPFWKIVVVFYAIEYDFGSFIVTCWYEKMYCVHTSKYFITLTITFQNIFHLINLFHIYICPHIKDM